MIYEAYVKESKIIDKTDEEKSLDLVKSLIKPSLHILFSANMQQPACKNFEFAEGELVDYYSYQIKANQAKINYLLKKIKRRGLIIDNIQEKSIKNLTKLEAI